MAASGTGRSLRPPHTHTHQGGQDYEAVAAPPQSPLLDVALWTAGAPSVSMALVAPSAMLLPALRRLEALFLLS